MDIGAPELLVVVVLLLLLFGGAQLPKLARNLGRAQHEFKAGLSEGQKNDMTSPTQVGQDTTVASPQDEPSHDTST